MSCSRGKVVKCHLPFQPLVRIISAYKIFTGAAPEHRFIPAKKYKPKCQLVWIERGYLNKVRRHNMESVTYWIQHLSPPSIGKNPIRIGIGKSSLMNALREGWTHNWRCISLLLLLLIPILILLRLKVDNRVGPLVMSRSLQQQPALLSVDIFPSGRDSREPWAHIHTHTDRIGQWGSYFREKEVSQRICFYPQFTPKCYSTQGKKTFDSIFNLGKMTFQSGSRVSKESQKWPPPL